jgi:hypothetical protein
MIDARFDMFDKAKRMREPDVPVERRFICPLGMNEK